MDIFYTCDPEKNVECSKKNCFINGGGCKNTRKLDFAKQPVETVKMVLQATVGDLEIFGVEKDGKQKTSPRPRKKSKSKNKRG